MRTIAAAVFVAVFLLGPDSALAHDAPGGILGLVVGVLNPYSVPAHAMALLSLGILIGRRSQGQPVVLAIFGLALIAGVLAHIAAVPSDQAEHVVLAGAAVCGALVAAALFPPVALSGFVAAVTGFAIALDSAPGHSQGWELLPLLAGSAAGAMVAALIAAAIAATREAYWQQIGLRIVGSWIAAGSVLVLALRLVR